MVAHLLAKLGAGIGAGYDIGCKFAKTISRTRLGRWAEELKFTSLVGLFHGHAHNRLCQLKNLGIYIKGIGIEDLEGCERFFARTNQLAGGFRYGSAFHRRQSLQLYFEHLDQFDTYEALSELLLICLQY